MKVLVVVVVGVDGRQVQRARVVSPRSGLGFLYIWQPNLNQRSTRNRPGCLMGISSTARSFLLLVTRQSKTCRDSAGAVRRAQNTAKREPGRYTVAERLIAMLEWKGNHGQQLRRPHYVPQSESVLNNWTGPPVAVDTRFKI